MKHIVDYTCPTNLNDNDWDFQLLILYSLGFDRENNHFSSQLLGDILKFSTSNIDFFLPNWSCFYELLLLSSKLSVTVFFKYQFTNATLYCKFRCWSRYFCMRSYLWESQIVWRISNAFSIIFQEFLCHRTKLTLQKNVLNFTY